MKPYCLLVLLFFCCQKVGFSQQYSVKGRVMEKLTDTPIPFVSIKINQGENHAFTDPNGFFDLSHHKEITQLDFSSPLHRDQSFLIDPQQPYLNIHLNLQKLFIYVQNTSEGTRAMMQEVYNRKTLHNAKTHGNFSYKTYNKFRLTSAQTEDVKLKLEKLLNKLKVIEKNFAKIDHDHHLFLFESINQRSYLNKNNHLESITAVNGPGIEKPTLLSATSQIQPFSLYDNLISLGGKKYYGPLVDNLFHWFRYETIDTVQVADGQIVTVQFNPYSTRFLEFLKGFLYIKLPEYALIGANVTPAIQKKLEVRFAQSYQPVDHPDLEGTVWFPHKMRTAWVKGQFKLNDTKIEAINSATVFDISLQDSLKSTDFTEIILDHEQNNQVDDPLFWEANRQERLTPKDTATFVFYDSLGKLGNFEDLIRLGEGFYYGEIPMGHVSLDMHKLLKVNQFEGVRLGVGFLTNNRVSRWWELGTYLGYGLGDQQFKYGANIRVGLPSNINNAISVAYKHDLEEAGKTTYAFDRPQLSGENIRNLRVAIMDLNTSLSFSLALHPLKYLRLQAGFSETTIRPQYEYQYQGQEINSFALSEIDLGFRFAFGEQYIRAVQKDILINSPSPSLWVQYRRNLPEISESIFDFHKFDVKLQLNKKFIGWGTSHLQISSGIVVGNSPYSRLYNGKGSFRKFAAIAYNSFETMNYNEFLSDKHVSIFFTHNFGKLYLRKFKKQPSIEMSHNIGFGTISKPEDHGINFRTMEKGFFESGMFMNNILVLKALGISTGLGAGLFARYGHYSYPSVEENLLFKFAVDIQI